jgi:hypothetical protein
VKILGNRCLAQHGHTVINPKLLEDDFAAAIKIAHEEFDKHRPDVIASSSRGDDEGTTMMP